MVTPLFGNFEKHKALRFYTKLLNILEEVGVTMKYKPWLLELLQELVEGVRAKVLGLTRVLQNVNCFR